MRLVIFAFLIAQCRLDLFLNRYLLSFRNESRLLQSSQMPCGSSLAREIVGLWLQMRQRWWDLFKENFIFFESLRFLRMGYSDFFEHNGIDGLCYHFECGEEVEHSIQSSGASCIVMLIEFKGRVMPAIDAIDDE